MGGFYPIIVPEFTKFSWEIMLKIEDRMYDGDPGARRQKASPSQICIAEAMQAPVGPRPVEQDQVPAIVKK